jgi:DNA-directed RNA polymerase specialized sigma24 family protein
MNTARKSNAQSSRHSHSQTDTQLQDDFDALVTRANQGDTRALGAIAIACRPDLLREAGAVMGDFAREAEDIVQDLLLELLEGRSRFTPAQGRAIHWMCGIVRAMARKRRAERLREWGVEEDP